MDDLSNLIERAQAGDKDAFGQIYNLFYRRIYRYCKFNLAGEAQDICQETFLRAYKSLGKFSEKRGGSFQAYLFAIARNLIIDYRRKKKDVPLKEYHDIEKEDNLENEIQRKEGKLQVHTALSRLKEPDRQIVVLRYFEEMTTYEVASAVGMKEGAVRVRLHRILKKLKEIIEE